jgi:hypothetical protein
MKRSNRTFGYLLVLGLLLAGCSSTPSNNYYVLTAREGPGPTGKTPSLGIGPIRIPEYLNRNALVYQRDGNQLQIARFERWAEPLEEGITRVLGLNLTRLLNTQNIRQFPWNADRAPEFGIRVRLLALDANEKSAQLEAEWLLHRTDTAQPLSRRISRFEYSPPGGETLAPEQLPGAYSELLYRLSVEIAAAIPESAAP